MSLENEKLSQLLGNADDDLLDEAYRTDSADKMQKKIKCEKSRTRRSFVLRPPMRIAVAALLLIVCIVSISAIPAMFGNGTDADISKNPSQVDQNPFGSDTTPPDTKQPGPDDTLYPDITLPTGSLHIDGLDMLNYYSAIRGLDEESGLISASSDYRGEFRLLNEIIVEDDVSAPFAEAPVSEPGLPPVIYYEIDPDQPIVISKVLLFQIELTDETGFLASKLGTGVIDVVISKNFVFGDDLITFKNGERYFSCLTNGGGIDHMEFSTHKYIEKFSVVKNFDQENYRFTVSTAGDQVIDFQCSIFKYGSTSDKAVRVVSKTSVVNDTHTYTIADLENYFNRGDLSQPDNADL